MAKIIKRDGLYVINNVNDGYNTLYNKLGGEFCDASEDAWYDKRERRIYGELKGESPRRTPLRAGLAVPAMANRQ